MDNPTSYVWTPPPELIAASNLTAFLRATGYDDYDSLSLKADSDPAWLMEEVFKFCGVRFYRSYDRMLDVSRGQPWARWCVGGTTNIVLNCIDKHRGTDVWDQTFLVWEGEDKLEQRNLSYREIDHEIGRLALALTDLGIGKGDVVALYMPNVPETFVAFFAVLKLGAILMPLFSGFGPAPMQTRLNHGGAKAVITASGTWRRGAAAPLKSVLDVALESSPTVQHVIVVDREGLEDRNPDAGGPRSLVARYRRRQGWRDRDRRNECGRSRDSAVHFGNHRRTEGLRLDPYRLHRFYGHARHDHLRRFQIVGPFFLPQ